MTDDLPGQLTFDDMTADRYTELVAQRNELAQENWALQETVSTLLAKNQSYQDEIESLASEYGQLVSENNNWRKMQTDEAIKNRRLEKEIRDLKATLDASQAHDGQWLV